MKIDNIGVGKKADIYSMGTKTNIYGKMQPYDVESEVTYYTSDNARTLDLHNMYFTKDIAESKAVFETYAKNTKSAVTGGNGMSLDIVSHNLQKGNGILIKDNYGQDVKNNRFSAVEISSYLTSIINILIWD